MSFDILIGMKKFTSTNQRIGEKGEVIACMYMAKHGYSILERNHTRKWGEIDIIACKDGVIHFIEVKAVSRENGSIRPEENMHAFKQRKLARTIETYLAYRNIGKWQCDLICVLLDDESCKAEVSVIEDIIL